MQLFIDWKVATYHWKPDCSIHGSWTPTAQHRTGPRHQDENLHRQPYIPDGRPALGISPSTFIQAQHWFHYEGEVSPTWSQEQAGGKTENTWHCHTKQDMQLCSSSDLSESMGQRYKTSFNLKQVREARSLWGIHRQTNTTAPMKTCLASAIMIYVWGLSVCTKCTEPAVQELIWLKALLQCRFRDIWGCPELPGRIHRWCFFLWLFFGCLLCWWWEREEVTASFIQVF